MIKCQCFSPVLRYLYWKVFSKQSFTLLLKYKCKNIATKNSREVLDNFGDLYISSHVVSCKFMILLPGMHEEMAKAV